MIIGSRNKSNGAWMATTATAGFESRSASLSVHPFPYAGEWQHDSFDDQTM